MQKRGSLEETPGSSTPYNLRSRVSQRDVLSENTSTLSSSLHGDSKNRLQEESATSPLRRRGTGTASFPLSSRQSLPTISLTSAPNQRISKGLPKTRAQEEATMSFFFHPRTLTVLVVMLGGFLYYALWKEADTVSNTKIGLSAASICFLIIGLLQFRDGVFIRPHPALWRVVLALSVLYQMFLVFLLFQSKEDARKLFAYYDSNLGVELPERSYAENCDITASNIWNQLDIFVVAHALGWFCKAIILRDYWLCWVLSAMFEIMEYSLQHHLPNFGECWWDHWIVDVLICNWLGTYVGMKTCECFEMKHYSWRGIRDIPTYKGKARRAIQQFTPHSWTRFEWGATTSFKNFVAVIGLIFVILQCELNAFYLKYLLWIPPEHPLNLYRLAFIFFASIVSVREAYQYLSDKDCKALGPAAWLELANIMTETLIIFKFGRGEFSQPAPPEVLVFWATFISSLVVYAAWQFWITPWREAVRSRHIAKDRNAKLSGSSSDLEVET